MENHKHSHQSIEYHKIEVLRNKNQHLTHETFVRTHTQNLGSSICKLNIYTLKKFLHGSKHFFFLIYRQRENMLTTPKKRAHLGT